MVEPALPSTAGLVAAERRGEALDLLFFWGLRPRQDGILGPSCLSQWWPAPFEVAGRTYASAEHYMMWGKAVLFSDEPVADQILAASDPAEVKGLGREVRGFDGAVWENHRYGVVVAGNRAKFGQHDDLRSYLTGTGESVLVEASPVDPVWGIGLAAEDPDAQRPSRWRGRNLLGFALMHVRAELRPEIS